MLGMIGQLSDEIDRVLLSRVNGWLAEADLNRPRVDEFGDDILDTIEGLTIFASEIIGVLGARDLALRIGEQVSDQNRDRHRSAARSVLGVDIVTGEPWLRAELLAFAAQNARSIKAIPEEAVTRVSEIVSRGVRQGTSTSRITEEVRRSIRSSRSRAAIIARDQVGSLNGQITRLRQQEIGVTTYEWNTVRDERVRGNPGGKYPGARPRHDVMHGMICRWDDPSVFRRPGETRWLSRSTINGPSAHPGEPILCRCFAAPQLDDLINNL